MTIKTALKKLHEKMTGKTATANTAGALISELADNYTGGGGGSSPEETLYYATGLRHTVYEGFFALAIRYNGTQTMRGGMSGVNATDLHTQIDTICNSNIGDVIGELPYQTTITEPLKSTACALKAMFFVRPPWNSAGARQWVDDSILLELVNIEANTDTECIAEIVSKLDVTRISRAIVTAADIAEVENGLKFVMTISYNTVTSAYSGDKTYGEIWKAVQNGLTVTAILRTSDSSGNNTVYMQEVLSLKYMQNIPNEDNIQVHLYRASTGETIEASGSAGDYFGTV